jgi:hypothetical protein
MGLTATAGTTEDQPADRSSGELFGRLVSDFKLRLTGGIAALSQRLQIFEGKARQRAQVAVLHQTRTSFVSKLPASAGAAHDAAVVRLPGGQQRVDDARALADSTVRTGRRRYIIVGPCVRIFP